MPNGWPWPTVAALGWSSGSPASRILMARRDVAGRPREGPAAFCRKVAEVPDGGEIEAWGDGKAMRAYTYIDDLLDGIDSARAFGPRGRVNIGRQEYVPVDELARTWPKSRANGIGSNTSPGRSGSTPEIPE